MGGRGGSSGLSSSGNSGLIDTSQMPKLTGSEKQVKWAEQIRDDAIGTVNANIKLAKERMDKVSGSSKKVYEETIDAYKEVGRQLKEELQKITSASTMIDRRNSFSGNRINQLATRYQEYQRKKKK